MKNSQQGLIENARRYRNNSRRNFRLLLVFTTLFVATLLRLYSLEAGLWYDEILTYVNYAELSFQEILTTYDSQNQHFLYSLLAHASFLIFGESSWALRVPAVIFGVASIWALYLFGRQVTSDREALLAILLLTFSYHHIWFSQNARGYTGLLFWTLFTSWLLVRNLGENRSQIWLLYAISAALGVYTQMTMIFVVISHFIIYVMRFLAHPKEAPPQNPWRGFFLGFCLAGLFTLLCHAPVLPQIFATIFEKESSSTAWNSPVWASLELVRGIQIGFASGIVATAAFLVFCIGLWSFLRENPLVIQLLVIPAFIIATLYVAVGHRLWPRLFFFTIAFGVLVVVRGAMVLGRIAIQYLRLETTRFQPLEALPCVGLILVSAISSSYAYGPKQDFGGALTFVEERKQLDDSVVQVGLAELPYRRFYKTNWQTVRTVGELNAIRSRAKRTWLLYTLPIQLRSAYPQLSKIIENEFKVVKRFKGTLGDGTIFVCQSAGAH